MPIGLDDGHDVLVRHKHKRLIRRFAFPLVKQCVTAHLYLLAGGSDVREFLVQHLVERIELLVAAVGDGGALNEFYKTIDITVFVFHTNS